MTYNLTPIQQEAIKWLIQQVKAGNLKEEFHIAWNPTGAHFPKTNLLPGQTPAGLTRNNLQVLANEGLVMLSDGPLRAIVCTLTAKAYEAIDSEFGTASAAVPVLSSEQIKIDLVKLSQLIQGFYSLDELDGLCFEAGLNFENIPGDPTLESKVRNLVQYVARHGKLLPLIIIAIQNRASQDWAALYN